MFSKEMIAFLIAALIATYLKPVSVIADDVGILRPEESGIVVVVDMDRNESTGRNPGNIGHDVRVPGAWVMFTFTDGAVMAQPTNAHGMVYVNMSIVASIDVTCPAIVGHTEAWQCGVNLPVNPSGWTPVFVQPLVGYLPLIVSN